MLLSLNPLKTINPYSILTKILQLFINDVSCQLSELIFDFFFHDVFSLKLKACKIRPTYLKASKIQRSITS